MESKWEQHVRLASEVVAKWPAWKRVFAAQFLVAAQECVPHVQEKSELSRHFSDVPGSSPDRHR